MDDWSRKVTTLDFLTKRAGYLVLVPMNDGEGGFLGQLLGQRVVVEERLGALPGADLPDAGDVQPSPFGILLGWLPAKTAQVYVQGVEAAVNPGVGPDLLQLTPALHEGQAVSCAAHLEEKERRERLVNTCCSSL